MCTSKQAQAGISFIELIMFIVVVSVGVTGVLAVMRMTSSHSSDPLPRKQAMAIAESLLEEIELQPFTYCDSNDPAWDPSNPTSLPPCTSGYSEVTPLGPETIGGVTESRYYVGASTPMFDNVNDYAGFSMTGIKPIDDQTNSIPGLESYSAAVTITNITTAEATALGILTTNTDAVLKITVRVTGPVGTDISLSGYRFRFAPYSF